MAKAPPIRAVTFPAEAVWGAAAAAHRINGEYLRFDDVPEGFTATNPRRVNNRMLMTQLLAAPAVITEADVERGRDVRMFNQGFLMKQLNDKINEFEQNALKIAGADTFDIPGSNYAFALIASAPASYERAMAREVKKELLADMCAGSEHIGFVGGKIPETEVTVLRSVYSQKYMTFFITAVADKNVVFFAYKNEIKDGVKIKIKGNIKSHREQGQTQLNRVKVVA